ncbi:hypothetical protein LINPERHAP1_LOCUS40271, partial [Linum perenne]
RYRQQEACERRRRRSGLRLSGGQKIREDLFNILDDSDPDPAVQDLDSVMKSFQQEISPASFSLNAPVVVDLTSDSGHSQAELGFLREASDDELGLPPSSSVQEDKTAENEADMVRVNSAESAGLGGDLWGFQDEFPSYDSFDLGEVVYDEGLLDYSNVCFDSAEYSDYSWRLEAPAPAE